MHTKLNKSPRGFMILLAVIFLLPLIIIPLRTPAHTVEAEQAFQRWELSRAGDLGGPILVYSGDGCGGGGQIYLSFLRVHHKGYPSPESIEIPQGSQSSYAGQCMTQAQHDILIGWEISNLAHVEFNACKSWAEAEYVLVDGVLYGRHHPLAINRPPASRNPFNWVAWLLRPSAGSVICGPYNPS